jgi:trk system potassium uptake protein TrkA
MRIVIVGAGEIGFYLAKRLSREKHDLTIIDPDPEKCAKAQETLDAAVIEGSGSSQKTLEAAELHKADMLIAASSDDSINVLACMIASRMGVKLKIARIRDPEYYAPTSLFKSHDLGIDLMIHPEDEVVEEIVRLLLRATATEIIEFEDGKILFVGAKLDQNCVHIGKKLKTIVTDDLRKKFRIVAILRGDRSIIPSGEDYLNKNDQIFAVTRSQDLTDLLSMTGKLDQKLEKVMVLGGGRIGLGVAKYLEERKLSVTLVESDKIKSRKAADQLNNTLVIHADGAEIDALAREGLLGSDALVAVTSDDETNIISSLFARHIGVPKTIALVNRVDYLSLMPVIGIDSTVNVRVVTSNSILRLVRRGGIISMSMFRGIDAEAIEYEAKPGSKLLNKSLKNMKLPDDALLAAIIRNEEVIIPYGEHSIEIGDRVIFFAMPQAIPYLENIFS